MSSKKVTLVIVASIVAAFVGGMMGVWLFMPTPVQAQDDSVVIDTLLVRDIQIVDSDGNYRGHFGYQSEFGTTLQVGNESSGSIYLSDAQHDGNTGITIQDITGKGSISMLVGSGASLISLRDAKGHRRSMWTTTDDGGVLAFTDQDENITKLYF
ncbi:hypothetical protein K8R78_00845 [bacterium]|nr:hypothetical protein [bacterium]